MITAIEKITDKKINTNYGQSRIGDPHTLVANIEKAQTILNWKPNCSELKTILTSTQLFFEQKK